MPYVAGKPTAASHGFIAPHAAFCRTPGVGAGGLEFAPSAVIYAGAVRRAHLVDDVTVRREPQTAPPERGSRPEVALSVQAAAIGRAAEGGDHLPKRAQRRFGVQLKEHAPLVQAAVVADRERGVARGSGLADVQVEAVGRDDHPVGERELVGDECDRAVEVDTFEARGRGSPASHEVEAESPT